MCLLLQHKNRCAVLTAVNYSTCKLLRRKKKKGTLEVLPRRNIYRQPKLFGGGVIVLALLPSIKIGAS